MAVSSRKELAEHLGHEIEISQYNDGESVTIECLTCGSVLIAAEDFEEAA